MERRKVMNTKSWTQSSIIVIGLIVSLLSLGFSIDKATQEQITDAAIAIVNSVAVLVMVYRRWKTDNPPIK
ncbi:hypothetical protein COX76_02295 [Candidatus Kaiserbacteria bacterium CG_4_10_14_0_2_um_filter_50_16]|nr:MAG: hypothetical protein COX76_02295 [Candidatus Kaiserbacteria bacterium CG_4_10_14_0_2_um_filter_50_16]